MDFLRDTAAPWLNIFRRLPLRIGPLDLSPIVAIIALQILGGIVIGLVRPA
jgi:YggT family protein